MNNLDVIFSDLMEFCDELIKDYGAPIKPSKEEIEKLKKDIISNSSNFNVRMPKNFYLIERVEGEVLFAYNIDKYLGLISPFNLMEFFSFIDDGSKEWIYLSDYLSWAKSVYSFIKKNLKGQDTDKIALKIRMPMQCSDGNIYWIVQESRFLETDKDNNLISHVNTYTISNLYCEKTPIGLQAELFFDETYQKEWSSAIAENRFSIKPFFIMPIQKQILYYFHENPSSTVKECADFIKYPLNTIKKYISDSQRKQGILDMAKVSFPSINIIKLKDVIVFLDKIGWFEKI
jgi:hypothetical protein